MARVGKQREHRWILYSVGAAICCVLLLAGFVFNPEPVLSEKDLEAEIALKLCVGDRDGAAADMEALLKLNPENLYGILTLAYIRSDSEDLSEAMALYRKGLALSGNHPDLESGILDTLSRMALKSGYYEEARSYSERKILRFGENIQSRYIIALSCFSLGDDKGYEENLARALEMGILSPVFYINLEDLIDDRQKLQHLYLQTLLNRAKYQYLFNGLVWI